MSKEELPTKNRRVLRVEKEIREIVGLHLVGGFHGELRAITTISRVAVTSDLRSARINVSVIGNDAEQDSALEILNKYAFEVQREIAKDLPLRYCPKVRFFLDKSLEKVLKVEKILFEISQQNAKKSQASSGVSSIASSVLSSMPGAMSTSMPGAMSTSMPGAMSTSMPASESNGVSPQ